MNIDPTFINELSTEDIEFATGFLETIFLKQQPDIALSHPQHVTVVSQLIQSSQVDSMRQRLLMFLDHSSRQRVFLQLPELDQHRYFVVCEDDQLLVFLYHQLASESQRTLMTSLYQDHRQIHDHMKLLLKSSKQMKMNVIVKKEQDKPSTLAEDLDEMMTIFTDAAYSVDDAIKFVNVVQERYSDKAMQSWGESCFKQMVHLQLPLNSKHHFQSYLKFFHAAVPLMVLYEEYHTLLLQVMDHFLLGLRSLPSEEWIIKILNQLPIFMITKCLSRITQFERISQFEKRNYYCNLLAIVNRHLSKKEAANIRFAYNQL